MESGDNLSLWLEAHLKPLAKSISPGSASWAALATSMIAGGLLFGAYETPWLALVVVPLLVARLALDSLQSMGAPNGASCPPHTLVLHNLCARLADLSLFLGLTFWPPDVMRVHLAMLAIVCMLLVSYAGAVISADNDGKGKGGLLCQSHRVILLMFFCLIHAFRPGAIVAGFSTFEVMFALFIPLASLTLIQRMDVLPSPKGDQDDHKSD